MGPDRGAEKWQELKLSEKYFRQKKEVPAQLCRFHTQRLRNRPRTQMHAAFLGSF